jgi:hypothetical protein
VIHKREEERREQKQDTAVHLMHELELQMQQITTVSYTQYAQHHSASLTTIKVTGGTLVPNL